MLNNKRQCQTSCRPPGRRWGDDAGRDQLIQQERAAAADAACAGRQVPHSRRWRDDSTTVFFFLQVQRRTSLGQVGSTQQKVYWTSYRQSCLADNPSAVVKITEDHLRKHARPRPATWGFKTSFNIDAMDTDPLTQSNLCERDQSTIHSRGMHKWSSPHFRNLCESDDQSFGDIEHSGAQPFLNLLCRLQQ